MLSMVTVNIFCKAECDWAFQQHSIDQEVWAWWQWTYIEKQYVARVCQLNVIGHEIVKKLHMGEEVELSDNKHMQ